MPISLLGIAIEFHYFNFVFDGAILFFTVIYFFAGLKRGIKRTLWFVAFDIISIVAAIILCKFVCPFYVDKIPALAPKILDLGTKFFLIGIFKKLITLLSGVIFFLIIRFGIFKKILVLFADRDYNLKRVKKGRLISGLLTAGLAFTLSTGAIIGSRACLGDLLFRNYETEMSETYIAKHAETFILKATNVLVETESIQDPNGVILNKLTDGKYTLEDFPNYRDSIDRLTLTSNPEEYLNEINASTNEGLISFNQDLHFYFVIAEQGGHYSILDEVIRPIALKAVELGYRYSGAEEDLFDFKQNQSFVSLETYEALLAIYY